MQKADRRNFGFSKGNSSYAGKDKVNKIINKKINNSVDMYVGKKKHPRVTMIFRRKCYFNNNIIAAIKVKL